MSGLQDSEREGRVIQAKAAMGAKARRVKVRA